MLSQLLCAVARRVESHALLVCFLASGHSCSCLYNSSAWKARIKNTLFFPLTRLLFSIVLHLSQGKYRLEPRRLGRELNPDVIFAGCCTERGKQRGRRRGERWVPAPAPLLAALGVLGQMWGMGIFVGCGAFCVVQSFPSPLGRAPWAPCHGEDPSSWAQLPRGWLSHSRAWSHHGPTTLSG